MSVQQNKARARLVFDEVWSQGRLDLADELLSPEFVSRPGGLGEPFTGTAGAKAFVAGLRQGFPDISFSVKEMIAEGDVVATRWTLTGTHEGEVMGLEPTGRGARLGGMTFLRFRDGMIVEGSTQLDTLGLMRTVGAMASRSQLAARREVRERPAGLDGAQHALGCSRPVRPILLPPNRAVKRLSWLYERMFRSAFTRESPARRMDNDAREKWQELWQEWELLEALAVSAPRGTLPELRDLAGRMAATAGELSEDSEMASLIEQAEMRAADSIAQRIEAGQTVEDDELTAALTILRSFVDRAAAEVAAVRR